MVVYRPFPTSNHNLLAEVIDLDRVVYRPFPTSNHNYHSKPYIKSMLYIVRFLHQTTTIADDIKKRNALYIVRFLHQTTTADVSALKEI